VVVVVVEVEGLVVVEGARDVVVEVEGLVVVEGARDVVVEVEGLVVEESDLNIEDGANCALMDCIVIVCESTEAVNKTAKLIPMIEKNVFI
jgi:hypothetical protein